MRNKKWLLLCVLIIAGAVAAIMFMAGVLPVNRTDNKTESAAKSEASATKQTQTTSAAQTDTALTQTIQQNYLSAVSDQKWSVYAEELTSDKKVVDINGDAQMQSASCVKVFIAAAAYARGLQDGESALIEKMITVSDNEAANALIKNLGGGDTTQGLTAVNTWCAQNGYTQTSMGRLFLEVNPTGDNYTSAKDLSGLLKTIYEGNCVSAQASSELLGYLTAQRRRTKIPAGVSDSGKTKTVANKTGEIALGQGTGCIENDAALIYDDTNAYTLVVLSCELAGDNQNAQARIRDIAKTVAQTWQ